MNQKDYKEIPKIIKEHRQSCYDVTELSKKLADYFEREELNKMEDWKGTEKEKLEYIEFNKKQFLKDCGVI